MKKKKWKPFLIASIAVLLIASIGIGIYAFLSDGDTANNRTTIGGVTTDIPEKFTPPDDIKPGDVITKDVKIRNTGKDDCYVRVRSLFSDSDMEKYCTVNYNTTDFTYNKNDGYYYYKKVLKKGETTPISGSMGSLPQKPKKLIRRKNLYEEEIYDGSMCLYVLCPPWKWYLCVCKT